MDHWQEHFSQSKRRKYWFNPHTGESRWTQPLYPTQPPQAPQEHYDRITTQSSQQAREENPAFHVRKLNNHVKRTLIERYSANKTVLDLACGKGGDCHKYHKVGASVTGLDISPQAIEEANRRSQRYPEQQYFATDLLKPTTPPKVDTVNCFFALHYFCQTPQTLNDFLTTVFLALKPGGHFVVTAPDPQAVLNYRPNPLFQVQITNDNAYTFTLPGSVENCEEYLLPDTLKTTARDFGLTLQTQQNFGDLVTPPDNPDEAQLFTFYQVLVFQRRMNR